jgi:hypothetical protein
MTTRIHDINCIATASQSNLIENETYFYILFPTTRPNLRFPDVVFTETHDLSYTCLAENRAEFLQINEMCRNFFPILHISYVHEIHIFV